jgi:hypothetical protein
VKSARAAASAEVQASATDRNARLTGP